MEYLKEYITAQNLLILGTACWVLSAVMRSFMWDLVKKNTVLKVTGKIKQVTLRDLDIGDYFIIGGTLYQVRGFEWDEYLTLDCHDGHERSYPGHTCVIEVKTTLTLS